MAGVGLKVYYDLMSQPSRAVVLFLKANNIPFTPKPVALRKGEHLGEEYGETNPFHLVPAIDDNGFKITESVAILKYLADKHQVPDHWYPKDLKKRAQVDSYMAWQHLNLRMFGAMVFRTKVIIPRETGEPMDTKKLAEFEVQLETCLDKIENILLCKRPFLAGDEISVADLLGICELMQAYAVGHDVFWGRPKLDVWVKRVQARLQPHFDQAHIHLLKLRERFPPSAKF